MFAASRKVITNFSFFYPFLFCIFTTKKFLSKISVFTFCRNYFFSANVSACLFLHFGSLFRTLCPCMCERCVLMFLLCVAFKMKILLLLFRNERIGGGERETLGLCEFFGSSSLCHSVCALYACNTLSKGNRNKTDYISVSCKT